MAETFRISKLEKFIQKQVERMEYQQKVINMMKQKHGEEITRDVEINNIAWFNYTTELCNEFKIPVPHVLGVTPN